MSKNVIEIRDLDFSYSPETSVLKIQEFDVPVHSKTFIYGPSGYGKTTLLNLITGVLRHQKGLIKVLDLDFSNASNRELNKLRGEKLGYIFQNFNLIPYLNVEENILLPSKLFSRGQDQHQSARECEEMLNALDMDQHRKKYPSQLSLGQQQRVAQMRALIGSPELIIADEPTSSLDQKNTDEFMQMLIEYSQKKKLTLVFVSHDTSLSKYFDHVIDLQKINALCEPAGASS